jgi:hypothetical protein
VSAAGRRQGAASAQVTRALAAVLASLNTQIKALEAQIAAQLAEHADGHIFTSLPRSGTIRAARLLTEIGDCRARFPDPQALICLAGAAPPARQSGKHKAVTFRWAVSNQLRDAVCDFADGSRHASPWAAQGAHRGEAYDALAAQDPPPHQRRFGSALIYGADRSAYLSVSYDDGIRAFHGRGDRGRVQYVGSDDPREVDEHEPAAEGSERAGRGWRAWGR